MINAIKLLLGMILGLAILVSMAGAAGYYFFTTNLSTRPKRPTFAEEGKPKPKPKPAATKKPLVEEKPAEKPEEKEQELPNGSYGATVTWEKGVSLRQEATDGSAKVGSVGFKEKVTVMQENTEKTWVQVRNSDGTVEGWLKSGNVERDPGSNLEGN
jgi:uncharacterized protein YgiM (DUF1202 family)